MWLLCKKDYIVNRGKIVLLVSVYLIFATLWFFMEQRSYFFLILSFPIIFMDVCLRNEPRTEALVCSLPVSRRLVVFSRFLTAALILLLGIGTTYLAAFLVRLLGGSVVMRYVEILGTGDLVMTISLFAMHVSAALLVFSRLGYPLYPKGLVINVVSTLLIWTGFSGILFIAVSLAASNWSLTVAGKSKGLEYLAAVFAAILGRASAQWGQAITLLFFVLFAVLCLLVSLFLAVKIFRQKDIQVSESDLEVL